MNITPNQDLKDFEKKKCTACEKMKKSLIFPSIIGFYIVLSSIYGTYVLISKLIENFF